MGPTPQESADASSYPSPLQSAPCPHHAAGFQRSCSAAAGPAAPPASLVGMRADRVAESVPHTAHGTPRSCCAGRRQDRKPGQEALRRRHSGRFLAWGASAQRVRVGESPALHAACAPSHSREPRRRGAEGGPTRVTRTALFFQRRGLESSFVFSVEDCRFQNNRSAVVQNPSQIGTLSGLFPILGSFIFFTAVLKVR